MRVLLFPIFLLGLSAIASHDPANPRKAASNVKVPDGLVLAADPGPPPPEGHELKEAKDRFAHWDKRFEKLKTDYAALAAGKNEAELAKRRVDINDLRPFKTKELECYRWLSYRSEFNPDAVDGWLNLAPGELGLGMEHGYPTIHETDRQRDVHGSVVSVPRAQGTDGMHSFKGSMREERRANLIPRRDITIEIYKSERGDLVIKYYEKSDKHEGKIFCIGRNEGTVEVKIARDNEAALLEKWTKNQTIGGGGRRLLTERVFPALRYLLNGTKEEKKKAGEYLQALLGTDEGPVVFRALHEYGKLDVDGQFPAPVDRLEREALVDLLAPYSPDWKAFAGLAYKELVNAPWLTARAKLLDDIGVQMRKDAKELSELIEKDGDMYKYHQRMFKDAGFEVLDYNPTSTGQIVKVKKDGIELTLRLDRDNVEIVKDGRTRAQMEVDVSKAFGVTISGGEPSTDPHRKRLQLSRFPEGKATFTVELDSFKLTNALKKHGEIEAVVHDYHYYNAMRDFLGKHFASSWMDIYEALPQKRKFERHQLLEGDAKTIGGKVP